MKMHSSKLVVALTLAAALFPAVAPARSAASSLPAPFQEPPDRATQFKTKFRQALEINAKEEIAKLVRSYAEEATQHVVELCNTLANGGSDQVEKELAALREAWKTSFKSGFVEHMYNYFSLLDPRAAKEVEKVDRLYQAAYKKYAENLTKKDGGVFDLLAKEFAGVGKAFDELGYMLFAGRAYNLAGLCVDTGTRGPAAEHDFAADYFGSALKALEAWEITDGWYQSIKARYEELTRLGKGTAGGSVPGALPVPGPEPVKAGEATISSFSFEAVPQLDKFVRPNYSLDEVHVLWPLVYMREKGTSSNFQALGKKVKILRTGSAALMLDVDGDDKGDKEISASGNKALVQFQIGEADDKREWACITEVGGDKETYQGLQVNVQPNDRQFILYVMNAASMVGMVNNVPVRIFDDNMDGIYGSAPQTWQYIGLAGGSVQPDLDAMLVGAEKHARPYSEFAEIGGAWFQLEAVKGGAQIKATPSNVEVGKLKLDYKGELPEYVVLQGEGALANTYIDLLQNGAGAEVNLPVGKYKLSYGIVRKGKKQQIMKALILPGPRTPTWDVVAGKSTIVQLGAPFGFDFEAEHKGETLSVKGASVVVVGAKGERYERLWNCAPRPELLWRKSGSKRASKPERFGIVENLNDVDDQGKAVHEYADTFHPISLSVEAKVKEGETVEVQLVEKKNKLFGVIESAWR